MIEKIDREREGGGISMTGIMMMGSRSSSFIFDILVALAYISIPYTIYLAQQKSSIDWWRTSAYLFLVLKNPPLRPHGQVPNPKAQTKITRIAYVALGKT